MGRKSQRKNKGESSNRLKKKRESVGQKVHMNQYVTEQKLDGGGLTRTIKVGKKQQRKGEKKKRVVTLKMGFGPSGIDVASYSFSTGSGRKYIRSSRHEPTTPRTGKTLADIPARNFRHASFHFGPVAPSESEEKADYELIFRFEERMEGDYAIISNDPERTFIRSLTHEYSGITEIYTRDFTSYCSLEDTQRYNKEEPGLGGEIRAIRKIIQENVKALEPDFF